MDWLNQLTTTSGSASLQVLVLSMAAAFLLGQLLAWTYSWTHVGLSYSRSFTQSLVLISMATTMVMYVIGSSLVTAMGLLGALAIIRFRNNLKDTRDTVFVFFSLIIGMSIGSGRIPAGGLATIIFCAAVSFLHFSAFGSRGFFDGHLRCRVQAGQDISVDGILKNFCLRTRRISASHGADSEELVFEILLRDKSMGNEFVQQLKSIEGVLDAGLVVRDSLQEA
ncbi:MAG TPA: DUF4956 domain-containing protein [Planctomycetota bacterium]|nr:hypothetical protein [Planctomycetota bacterium]MDP7246292.1 DUF4956 domain-containing protein [Planctomycetota bacterium]HJM38681.1 DUF4956 domain-containing protein [Planctomycetota bacterium]